MPTISSATIEADHVPATHLRPNGTPYATRTEAAALRPADALSVVLGGKQVLVINPDPFDRAHLEQILRPAGWDLRVVSDVASAVQSIRRPPPPVIFVPVQHFDELSSALPAKAAVSKLVAVVGFARYWHTVDAMDSRAFDVIAKPFAEREVLQVANFAWSSLLLAADPNGWN